MILKVEREARKSSDYLDRNFRSGEPLRNYIADVTEIQAKDGKLYVSALNVPCWFGKGY